MIVSRRQRGSICVYGRKDGSIDIGYERPGAVPMLHTFYEPDVPDLCALLADAALDEGVRRLHGAIANLRQMLDERDTNRALYEENRRLREVIRAALVRLDDEIHGGRYTEFVAGIKKELAP